MKAPEEIIKKLQDYFAKRDDIVLAYLFGSQAKGTASFGRSDYDIAVYFKPKSGKFEYEERELFYDTETEIENDVSSITKTEVDIVVLNRAPADIVFSAINGTIVLLERDHDLWMDLIIRSQSDAEEYRAMVHDFFEIRMRSNSLSPQDRVRLEKIITFLENEILEVVEAGKIDQRTFEYDRGKRKILEKSVENVAIAGVDIGKILLASHLKNVPDTYSEVMKNLSNLENFPEKIALWLARGVRLRNFVAHEYLDLEYKRLQDFTKGVPENYTFLVSYIKQVMIKEAGGKV